MHIPWQDCEVFIAVAELGSFSAAARQLRLTQPTVSRRIAAMEDNLGRPLFRRDSEGTHLTPEGERLLPAAEQMARWATEMERAASSWEDEATGTVRCAVPPGVAFELMVEVASLAKERYPALRLELLTGIEHIDLTRGEAELAIRTRLPNQPELVVVNSFTAPLAVLGSPALAETLPEGAIDASDLPWITWSYPLEHVEPRPFLEARLDPFRIALASNDYLVQRRAVDAGLGVFIASDIEFSRSSWGPLVEIETNLELPREAAMHIVCARSMRHVPRVRVVFELIDELLAEVDGIRIRPGDPD